MWIKKEKKMKTKLIILGVSVLVLSAGYAYSAGGHDHGSHEDEHVEEKMDNAAANVENKICPVSGEKIGSMGKAYHVEHDGKVYNLCCKMCAKDFKKNPEKYLEKVKEELESSSHDDHESKGSKGSHKGSHKKDHDHSGHDHDGHDH